MAVEHTLAFWFQTAEVYRALLEAAPDALVLVDNTGNIVFVNAQAETLFGYVAAELLGQPVEVLIPAAHRQQHTTHVKHYQVNPQARRMGAQLELCACRKDGSVFPAEISLSPVTTEHGTITMSAIRDITDRKKVEQALREIHDQLELKVKERTLELEALNIELDAFAHTVAHDLKNPLTVMVGMADTLRSYYSTLSPQELEQYLMAIARDGRKMDNIINELLILASVGQLKPQPESLTMAAIVEEAMRRLEYRIKEKRVELILPANWPLAIGYAPWIESVWVNYLSNAIKYGGQPPHIELGATPLPDNTVKFWIRDNGRGLSDEEQSRLFREFTRLGDVKRVEGHGVGLSIVRRIVENLGGRVGVESRPGCGCTFFFTLPGSKNSQG